jgi:nucleoside-diphosphate-sugar epimerase
VGVDIDAAYAPERPGEVQHIALDAARAQRELGWEWTMDLADGVADAVAFYRRQQAKE